VTDGSTELLTEGEEPRAFFDWYAATIDDDPTHVVESLAGWLGATWRYAKGMHGYTAGAELHRDGNLVARVIYGGNEDAAPHAWASGEDAAPFAAAVRALWPEHRVSRVDVAYDFREGEPWDVLYTAAVDVADHLEDGTMRAKRIKLATIGDWLRADEGYPDGRTLYIGSMKSPVMARLYEKGKQMRKLLPDQADKFPPGWVRLELQVRPKKQARYDLAKLSPLAIWGTSKWARQLHARVMGQELAAVPVEQRQAADDDRAWYYLLKQYGPLLRRMVDLEEERITRDGGYLEPGARGVLWADLGRRLGSALG